MIVVFVGIPAAVGIYFLVRYVMKSRLRKSGACHTFMCKPCKPDFAGACPAVRTPDDYRALLNIGRRHYADAWKAKTCLKLGQLCT